MAKEPPCVHKRVSLVLITYLHMWIATTLQTQSNKDIIVTYAFGIQLQQRFGGCITTTQQFQCVHVGTKHNSDSIVRCGTSFLTVVLILFAITPCPFSFFSPQ